MRLGRASSIVSVGAGLLGQIGARQRAAQQRWNWPVCMLCHARDEDGNLERDPVTGGFLQKEVDKVELVDAGPRHMTVRGHCHGAEDVIKVEFPSDTPEDSGIRRGAWRSISFFNKLITG